MKKHRITRVKVPINKKAKNIQPFQLHLNESYRVIGTDHNNLLIDEQLGGGPDIVQFIAIPDGHDFSPWDYPQGMEFVGLSGDFFLFRINPICKGVIQLQELIEGWLKEFGPKVPMNNLKLSRRTEIDTFIKLMEHIMGVPEDMLTFCKWGLEKGILESDGERIGLKFADDYKLQKGWVNTWEGFLDLRAEKDKELEQDEHLLNMMKAAHGQQMGIA